MESFDELLGKAEAAHGHLCAGQILGVRMALLGLVRLGIADPHGADRKRLVTYVEIDRCATDALSLVTGCRLGRRGLKFRDWGKMAATFVNLTTSRAIRIVALEESRELARRLYPHLETVRQQQMRAYRELPDANLFREQWVRVEIPPAELPGYKAERFICPCCGEGVSYGRFVEVSGERRCLACARPELRYWEPVGTDLDSGGQDSADLDSDGQDSADPATDPPQSSDASLRGSRAAVFLPGANSKAPKA